ncbi:MAG TPA: hypothetical protein VG694_02835 [Candidatus Paceibacterota bacterium]|jgi:hypothetical protein|nr:hypothetical protein [Candidatus Paceibacterota bacterium]
MHPKKKRKIIALAVILALMFVSYYIGDRHGRSKALSARQSAFAGRGFPGQSAAGGNRGVVTSATNGEIISSDQKSITIKLPSGGSKIIFIDSNTKVSKVVDGAKSDLAKGTNVTVNGAVNSDGSMNASSIQIRPTPPSSQTNAGR